MSLSDTIEKVNALKRELDSLRPIQPEYEARLKQKFRLELTYNSNSIEGNSLTFGETKTLLLHGLTTGNKPLQDYREIEGHNKLLLELESLEDKRLLFNQSYIRSFHVKIFGGESKPTRAINNKGEEVFKELHLGSYKTEPNHVKTATGEDFLFTMPGAATEAAMTDLIDWCNSELEKKELHPLVFASLLHYRFILIHPFDDGNGRMARILMNIPLEINGYPPIIVRREDKENYYVALRIADGGNVDAFTEYLGNELIRTLEISIKAAKGENVEEDSDIDKEFELNRRHRLEKKKKFDEFRDDLFESQLNIIRYSFLPLVEGIDSNVSKYDRDFSEVNRRLDMKTIPDISMSSVFFMVGKLSDSIESILMNHLISQERSIRQLTYHLHFDGKNNLGVLPKKIMIEISVNFGLSDYTLSATGVSNKSLLNRSVSNPLSKEELKEIKKGVFNNFEVQLG